MARRISLREFQENLVKRLAEARTGDRRTLLGIEASADRWLVDLTDTGEVLPVPPISQVPLTRPWFKGVTNVRGTLYGVVDFSGFHGHQAISATGRARLLLIHPRHGVNSALLFSRTSGLHSPEEFENVPGSDDPRPWVDGLARDIHGGEWLRLNIGALIRHPEFLEAGLASSGSSIQSNP